jgi:hypothetical protein
MAYATATSEWISMSTCCHVPESSVPVIVANGKRAPSQSSCLLLLRLLQAVVSVQQQIPGGGRIDEHHHPMGVDLAVPECPAEIDLAGHALAQGVEICVLAVVRLVCLEAGESQALENRRVAVDVDVQHVPDLGPESSVLGHQAVERRPA